MAARKKLNFESSMARLEEIVSLLEKGDAPLEKAMSLFEEGAGLLRESSWTRRSRRSRFSPPEKMEN